MTRSPSFAKPSTPARNCCKGEIEKPLRDVLWGEATDLLEQTAYTQPALFALEFAISELWKSWGISPGVVLGHSVGEYVAACIAGVYSLADGLRSDRRPRPADAVCQRPRRDGRRHG